MLRDLQTSRANKLRIPRIKNAKFLGYCFYMNTNIQRDFQICISIPLKDMEKNIWERPNQVFKEANKTTR